MNVEHILHKTVHVYLLAKSTPKQHLLFSSLTSLTLLTPPYFSAACRVHCKAIGERARLHSHSGLWHVTVVGTNFLERTTDVFFDV